MNEDEKLISVIVPIYNRESILKRCIESILNQSYKNIQVILVDDGSIDNSLLVCKDYANRDSRILVISQKNGGPAVARNAGMDAAKGDYVMFVDSDDSIHPQCIELLYGAIKQFNVNIAMCEYGEQNHQMIVLHPQTHTVLLDVNNVLKNGLYEKEKMLYCWAKLWTKESIKSIRYKPFSFCEDALFTIEAFLFSKGSIAQLKGSPLYYYLRKSDSITKNLSDKNLLDSLEVAETVLMETEFLNYDIQKSAIHYYVSAAFFAYLQAGSENEGDLIKVRAFEVIRKYRKVIIFNVLSSLKARAACLISFFSMNAVKIIYRLIKA